jgi:hypothetical protein
MLGGLTAEGEQCSAPSSGLITCGPSATKQSRSWYDDIPGDPFLTYMYETCKTVGRVGEAQARVKKRFLAAEQSAVEQGLRQSILANLPSLTAPATIAQAIGMAETEAAAQYGAQIILHISPTAAAEASRENLLRTVGDHLETVTGNLVSVGNYGTDIAGSVTIYATGAMDLYRGDLVEIPPSIDRTTNDYFALVERAYAALVDCFGVSIPGIPLCACGDASSSGGPT